MSDKDAIIQHMIDYIEQKERDFQASKLSDSKKHSEIVKNIISELEKEIENENKKA